MRHLFFLLAFFPSILLKAQAKLVLNGGIVNITNGAALVIDNGDNASLVRNGSGFIQSEGTNNRLLWTIGGGTGLNYLVPFGNAVNYLPLRFTASGGSGSNGQIVFSTYPTPTWNNSNYLPPGVTNVNNGSSDNSANVMDRFWQIAPQNYSTKPTLANLSFSYAAGEFAAPNTIAEGSLIAQRWNTVLNRWDDFIAPSSVNTANKTVTVSSVPGAQLFTWWTLANGNTLLPLSLLHFTASVENKAVRINWQTAFEQNSHHFEVWRSRDALAFDLVGTLPAAGNGSGPFAYTLIDPRPYPNTSFYRLKSVDKDAKFSWSPVVSVNIPDESSIFLYPNPVTSVLFINSSPDVVSKKPLAKLFDAKGSLLQSFALTASSQRMATEALPAGTYRILLVYSDKTQTLPFIKK